jgi:hypothetical protein
MISGTYFREMSEVGFTFGIFRFLGMGGECLIFCV